jgi:predicted nucleotide-binding protein
MAKTPTAVAPADEPDSAPERKRRKAIAQTDIPSVDLDEALRVARALGDDYAFQPSTPLDIARSVGMQPGSGPFRTLLGASAAYGLTEGSAWAEKITITPVGRRVVRPTEDGDDLAAKREAFMKPHVTRKFLTSYNRGKVPRDEIARNVLAEKFEIPGSEAARVFKQVIDDARSLGLLTDIGGVEYVQLDAALVNPVAAPAPTREDDHGKDENASPNGDFRALFEPPTPRPETVAATAPPAATVAPTPPATLRKMFMTHGSNKAFVELLKQLLKYGELEAVVAEQRETSAVPVPDKVIGAMRGCGSAIIHVDAERTITDPDGNEHVLLNENVLIEIGAAMALYDKRFILLVREGVKLPSNLQGLYQLRYTGDTLDAATALKLLEAITDIKNRPLPTS